MNLDPLGLNANSLDPLGIGAPEVPKDASWSGKVKRFASENFGGGGVPGVEMGLPTEESKGLAQGTLSAGTGLFSWIPGGLVMSGHTEPEMFLGGQRGDIMSQDDKAKLSEKITGKLTYQPKDESGQAVAKAWAAPFTALEMLGEKGGEYLDEKGYPILAEGSRYAGKVAPFMIPLALKGAGVPVRSARKGLGEIGGMEGVLEQPKTPTVPVERFPMGTDAPKSAYNPDLAASFKRDLDPLRLTESKDFQLVDREKETERWKADQEAEAAGIPVDTGLDPLGIYGKEAKPSKTQQRIDSYSKIIDDASAKFGVDEGLIRGVIEAESRGKSDAVSPVGAKGLMQLMDGTAKDLGVLNAFDPAQNIYGGTRYLGQLLNRYKGNVEQALAAYNWGMGRVDALVKAGKFDRANLPKETQNYLNRILNGKKATGKTYEGYREIGKDEVLQPGVDVKMDMETGKNYVKEEAPKAEGLTPEDVIEKPVEEPKLEAPVIEDLTKVAEGEKAAGLAKSIEAKAIEAGLTKDGFDKLAGFNPTTMKAQAEHAAKVMGDVENARKIIRGEEPLPEGLRGVSLIKAMEEHIKKTKDPQLAYELANSPLASEVSAAAQELSLTRGRELDSFAAKVAEVKRAREAAAGIDGKKVVDIKNGLKKKVKEVNLPKEDLFWSKFLKSIEC